MLQYNKELKENSRSLRNNMTDAERLLWSKIRNRQIKDYRFIRQKIIGNYIVDFYCPKSCLIIELDGGQHYTDDGKQKDEVRDKFLAELGFRVLRFSDRDVLKNINGVIDEILKYL
jgi:very-short-patch-repair endonuclease